MANKIVEKSTKRVLIIGRVMHGTIRVWSIFDNAWVTLEYWNYINNK